MSKGLSVGLTGEGSEEKRGWNKGALRVKMRCQGTFLVVQWLRFPTANAGGVGSIPGRGTKISHAAQRGQKI